MARALVPWIYELTGALRPWIVKDDYLAFMPKKEMVGTLRPEIYEMAGTLMP